MKDKIEQVLIKVDEGTMPVQQALAELLVIFSVVRPKPDCPDCKGSGGVQTGFEEYSTCPCVQGFGEPLPAEGQAQNGRDGVNGGQQRDLDIYQNLIEP